jgi:hypothetical protein
MPAGHLCGILLTILCCGIFNGFIVNGQEIETVSKAEENLKLLSRQIPGLTSDSAREEINSVFFGIMQTVLEAEASFQYPFDSLPALGKLTSPDHKFRMYLWNLPSLSGKHSFFGFIQINNSRHHKPTVVVLTDKSDSIGACETEILTTDRWYGALYYRIIPMKKSTGETFYTLLGWDGNNSVVTQKIIEILSFDNNVEPQFGARIFPNYSGGQNTRVIFRYSASSTMTLRYDEQFRLPAGVKQGSAGLRTEEGARMPAIVADHLAPLDPSLEGQYNYYVPESDNFDAFIFENGLWKFIPALEAKNKR